MITIDRNTQVPTEPADIIALLTSLGVSYGRIGIEAGPLSQWLVNALTAADLPVICVETRHMKALLTARRVGGARRSHIDRSSQDTRSKPHDRAAPDPRWHDTGRAILQRRTLGNQAPGY